MECSYPGTLASNAKASPSSSATRQMRPIQPAETSSNNLTKWGPNHESSSAYSVPGSEATNSVPSSQAHSRPGEYPSAPGHPSHETTRELSVVSNSSSSHSGASMVREANDYLSQLTDPEILEIPESRERRMWELKLMHNYVQSQVQQYAGAKSTALHGEQPTPGVALQDSDLDPSNPDSKNAFGDFVWGREIPKLALESDAILYSMLASSALDMWSRAAAHDPPERARLALLQHKYLSMAMREQRLAVGRLGRDNADTTCMASLTILQSSFALVQMLPVRPWQPPLDWLRMGRGAGAVLIMARAYLRGEGAGAADERTTRFIRSSPRMEPEELFAAGNRAHLSWLLDDDRGDHGAVGGGDDDDETRDREDAAAQVVYGKVLSFVGYMQRVIAAREPIYAVVRRLAGFAVYTPELYHELLAQRRPRALVALAHFFKLWIPYEDVWQVGRSGENQVRGIYEALPPAWKHKVEPIFDEYDLER